MISTFISPRPRQPFLAFHIYLHIKTFYLDYFNSLPRDSCSLVSFLTFSIIPSWSQASFSVTFCSAPFGSAPFCSAPFCSAPFCSATCCSAPFCSAHFCSTLFLSSPLFSPFLSPLTPSLFCSALSQALLFAPFLIPPPPAAYSLFPSGSRGVPSLWNIVFPLLQTSLTPPGSPQVSS